jgi:hypothetical protein
MEKTKKNQKKKLGKDMIDVDVDAEKCCYCLYLL